MSDASKSKSLLARLKCFLSLDKKKDKPKPKPQPDPQKEEDQEVKRKPSVAILRSHSLPGDKFVLNIPPERSFQDYYSIQGQIGSGSFGSVYFGVPKESAVKPPPPAKTSSWLCVFSPQVKSGEQERVAIKMVPKSRGKGEAQLSAPSHPPEPLNEGMSEVTGWLDKFGSKLLHAALTKQHPNVVKYRQFLEDDQHMYVVMDLYTGCDLFDFIIDSRPISEAKAAGAMRQILEAVTFIHACGGMHRDIKPENFIFEHPDLDSARLKLVDLGSASGLGQSTARELVPVSGGTTSELVTALSRNDTEDTKDLEEDPNLQGGGQGGSEEVKMRRSLSVVGTTGYCAPEVFSGKYDERCDCFSVGVILFVMLTGEMPFECRDVHQYQRSLKRAESKGLHYVLTKARGDRLSAASQEVKDLLYGLLALDCKDRLTAYDALMHPWIVRHAGRADVKGDTAPVRRRTFRDKEAGEETWFQAKLLTPLMKSDATPRTERGTPASRA